MLTLHNPYFPEQFNDQSLNVIKFECRHCGQPFGPGTLGITVFLYGVFFLTGKNKQYSGITCPKCLNSILLDVSDRLDDFFDSFNLLETPKGETIVNELHYYSPASCLAYQNCLLDGFETLSCNILLSGVAQDNFHGIFFDCTTEKPLLNEEYLCSFIWQKSPPIGSIASIFWFKEDDLNSLLSIENECKIKIFPRYYYKNTILTEIEIFCWEQYLSEEFAEIENIWPSIHSQKDIKVGSNFLQILLSNYNFLELPVSGVEILNMINRIDAPFEAIGLSEDWSTIDLIKFKDSISEKDKLKIAAELEALKDKSYVHKHLNDNYFKFVHDYIELSARTDFSYGSFRSLQMQYLTELYEFAHKESLNDAQYAFFPEGDAWTIIFEGKSLRKLSGGGFKYLHRLVSCPGRVFYTVDLDDTNADPYEPSDETHSASITSAAYEEDADNDDTNTYDDDQSEEDGTASKSINEIDNDGFEDRQQIDDAGSYDLELSDIQKIDTNGAIWISQGKTFERNNLGPVLDNQIMPEAKKLLNEFLKEKKIAEDSGDKKQQSEVVKKYMMLKKELFKYMKEPKNHFGNATEKESNRISQAIRRAVFEILGDERSPQRELREKIHNHFLLALNTVKNRSQIYIPIDDIKWKLR